MPKQTKCSTPSCTESARSAGLCPNCYSYHYYWQRRGVAATMRRIGQVQLFRERLEDIRPTNVEHIRPTNVEHIRRRKRA